MTLFVSFLDLVVFPMRHGQVHGNKTQIITKESLLGFSEKPEDQYFLLGLNLIFMTESLHTVTSDSHLHNPLGFILQLLLYLTSFHFHHGPRNTRRHPEGYKAIALADCLMWMVLAGMKNCLLDHDLFVAIAACM